MSDGEITTNDGTRIHHTDDGQGRPLVIVHGWRSSRRFSDRNVAALAEHARVLRVDLRGHGDSSGPGHGYRVPRLARDLFDLLEALDLQDVTVLGAQVELDTAGFDRDQLSTTFATEPTDADRELLLAEMAKAPPSARTAIMADHTRQDRVFPWQGPAWVGENVPGAHTVYFEHSSHGPFFDEPEEFNDVVERFAADGTVSA